MKLSGQQMEFINDNLHRASGLSETRIIETNDPNIMGIMIWNPLMEKDVVLKCPDHVEKLVETHLWTHSQELKSRSPRLLYHIGSNALLVSKLYQCSKCSTEKRHAYDAFYMAHHPEILSQLQEICLPPFLLFSIAGITRSAYEFIVNLAIAGTTFREIATCFDRTHGFHVAVNGKVDEIMDLKHRSPSWMFVQDVFMFDFRLRLSFYESEMKKITPQEIAIDHTFKTR